MNESGSGDRAAARPMSRREAMKKGTFVAGIAWIAPVVDPVRLVAGAAEVQSNGQPGPDDPGGTPRSPDPLERVLSDSQTRGPAPAPPADVAPSTPSPIDFVG